jgi:hypothetical protein
VARYPLKAEKLLDTAERLVPREAERGRPAYADHRRAISTAYYAVFHAICDRVAKTIFPDADEAFLNQIRRWVRHGDIKEVSMWVSQLEGRQSGSPPRHIAALLKGGSGTHVDAYTLTIADGFLVLNDKREQADYDHEAVFTRAETLLLIDLAKAIVVTVEEFDTDSTKRFYGLIAMRSKIQAR